jgi:hypothetical protein
MTKCRVQSALCYRACQVKFSTIKFFDKWQKSPEVFVIVICQNSVVKFRG